MKIRAGVFFGGQSVEHEVSVISGMQAIAAMDKEKYEVIPVYVAKDGAFWTGAHLADLESYRDIPAALARAQLRQGRAIAEVAQAAGFADQAHLQRAFKQHLAATPGHYRNAGTRARTPA